MSLKLLSLVFVIFEKLWVFYFVRTVDM